MMSWTKISMITKTRKRPLGKQERELLPVTPPKSATYITLEPGKCKAGEEKNAEGPKDAEPAPETAPQEEPAEAVKEAASPVPAESATVEEDTDGAGK